MLKPIDDASREQLAAEAQQDYADVVYRLAIGDDPTFERVVAVLSAVGKTAVELTNDVAQKQKPSATDH